MRFTNLHTVSRYLTSTFFLVGLFCSDNVLAQKTERLLYGDMNNWVTRLIKESSIIGGKTKVVYEIGPSVTITKNQPYTNLGSSPWATSNVFAKVMGITKASNAVYPFTRENGDKAVKMASQLEGIKVLGMINMDVMVAGSIFLGQMIEPVSSTSDPYSKMETGIPYTKRPSAVIFDYKVDMPDTDTRIKSTGFGSKKTLPGRDSAVMYVILQRRWEDKDGNLHAKRVATGGEIFSENQPHWVNGHVVPIKYGNVKDDPKLSWLGLKSGDKAIYAYNSKDKLVKVQEEDWDSPDATPTHLLLLFSAGNSEPFIGSPGLDFYVDNVSMMFDK